MLQGLEEDWAGDREGASVCKLLQEAPELWAATAGGKDSGGEEQSGEFAKTRAWICLQSFARQLLIRSPQTGGQEINVGLQVHLC